MNIDAIKTLIVTKALTTWNKIKDGVMAVLGVLTLVLLGLYKLKSDEVNSLKSQMSLLKTQEEANALQTQINQSLSNAQGDAAKVDQLNQLLTQLNTLKPTLPANSNQVSQDLNKDLGQ